MKINNCVGVFTYCQAIHKKHVVVWKFWKTNKRTAFSFGTLECIIFELNFFNLQSTWWYDKRRQSLDISENSFLQDSQVGQSHIQCGDIPILDLVKYVFQVTFFAHTT